MAESGEVIGEVTIEEFLVVGAVVAIVLLLVTVTHLRRRLADSDRRLASRQEQFSVLAHEIKTPLALIAVTVELMLAEIPGHLTGDQRAFLYEIDQSATRILLLADNILTESKLQNGVFAPTIAPVDIRDIVREVWRTMRRLAEQRNQQIALDYPQVMDMVEVDTALMRQAITNLVQNAIRHTSDGGIVTLRAFQNEQEIVVAVWDDGSGMSPDERKRAFRQFVSHSGGTGLGLTIVETIAQLHGGSVKVDTTLGKGAAFLLTLPRATR